LDLKNIFLIIVLCFSLLIGYGYAEAIQLNNI